MLFQKPGGVSAALALKGPLLVSTESHPVRSGVLSQYRGPGAGRAASGARLPMWPGPEGGGGRPSGWAGARAPAHCPGLFLSREPGPTHRHPGSLGEEIPPSCQVLGGP